MKRRVKVNTRIGALRAFLSVLRQLGPFIKQERKILVIGSLALTVETAVALLEPWPLKFIVDRVIDAEAANPAWLGLSSREGLLMVMAGAVVLLAGVRAAASYSSTVALAVAASRIAGSVRVAAFRHVQRLPLSFHTSARGGDLTARIVGDTSRLQDVSVTALAPMTSKLVAFAGMVAIMFWLDWKMALIAIALLPLFLITTTRISSAIQGASRDLRAREGAMSATAAESLTAIKVVQSLSLEKYMDDSFGGDNSASLSTGARTKRLQASLERSTDILIALATAGVLWYGGHMVLTGSLTPGELIVFAAYMKSGFRPLRDLAKYSSRMARATASGERVLSVLATRSTVREWPWAKPASRFAGTIEFEDVGFAYEPGHYALRRVSFSIRPGERVAFVGPSGSGKSTLINLLLRLYDPDQGRVLIDGQDVRDMTIGSLRTQMGVVLQDSMLFAASAKENIALGGHDPSDEEILAAARVANAEDFIREMPNGFETVLGERGATLSGGQRQRIAIARAAIRDAPILLLDEPTTGLDDTNKVEVMAALRSLCDGRTTLMVLHDMEMAAEADRIFLVEEGFVRELPGRSGGGLSLMAEVAGTPSPVGEQYASVS